MKSSAWILPPLLFAAVVGGLLLWGRPAGAPGIGGPGGIGDLDVPPVSEELSEALRQSAERFPEARRRRFVVLAMDSCDPDLTDRLIREGKLPHFARLQREGASGYLESITPLLSPVVWTTVATGMPPERHGILDFVTSTSTGKVPVSSKLRQADTVWELLAYNGASVGVVGWWATYPADPLPNAHVITERMGMLAFEYGREEVADAPQRTWPPDLATRYAREKVTVDDMPPETGREFLDVSDADWGRAYTTVTTRTNLVGNLRLTMATAETFRNMGLRLLREERPQFLVCYFNAMDALSHFFMPYAPPRMPNISEEDFARYSRVMEANYRWHDRVLGEFMELCDEDTTLLLVSDHGFKSGAFRMPESSDFHAKTGAMWHRRHGVFFAWGSGVKAGARVTGASVYDLTPTILAAMGYPTSQEMRGRVLDEAFEGGLPHETVPTYYGEWRRERLALAELEARENSDDTEGLSPDQIEELERLKSLGYIGDGDRSDPATTNLNLGNRLLVAGRVHEALEQFEKALEHSRTPRVLFSIAGAYLNLGNIDEAERYLDEAQKMAPEDTHGMVLRSHVLRRRGDLPGAEKVIRRAVALKPHLPEVHNVLAEILERRAEAAGDEGDAAELRRAALRCRERALEREPLQVGTLFQAARLRLDLDRTDRENVLRAVDHLDKVVQLRPQYRSAHNNHAVAHLILGVMAGGDVGQSRKHFEEALRSADTALTVFPDYPTALANRAYALWKLRRDRESADAARACLRADPAYELNVDYRAAMKAAGEVLIGE